MWGASLLSLPSCHTSHHRSCSEWGFSFPLGLTFLSGDLTGASVWRTPSHLIYSYNQCPSDGWPLTHLTFPYICFFICAGDDGPEEEVYRLTHGHIRLGSPGRGNHCSRSGGQVSDDNNDTCLNGQTYAHTLYTLLSIIPPHRLDFITPRASSSALRHTLTSPWHCSSKKMKEGWREMGDDCQSTLLVRGPIDPKALIQHQVIMLN